MKKSTKDYINKLIKSIIDYSVENKFFIYDEELFKKHVKNISSNDKDFLENWVLFEKEYKLCTDNHPSYIEYRKNELYKKETLEFLNNASIEELKDFKSISQDEQIKKTIAYHFLSNEKLDKLEIFKDYITTSQILPFIVRNQYDVLDIVLSGKEVDINLALYMGIATQCSEETQIYLFNKGANIREVELKTNDKFDFIKNHERKVKAEAIKDKLEITLEEKTITKKKKI